MCPAQRASSFRSPDCIPLIGAAILPQVSRRLDTPSVSTVDSRGGAILHPGVLSTKPGSLRSCVGSAGEAHLERWV